MKYFYGYAIALVLTLSLIGCGGGSGDGDGGDANQDLGTDPVQTSSIDAKYYGAWKYAHDGSEVYVTSTTDLEFTEIDENLLETRVNGYTRYLVRNGFKAVDVSGAIKAIATQANQASSRAVAKSGTQRIGGINIVLENIHDNKIKKEITSNEEDGTFSDNSLPSGQYKVTVESDDIAMETEVTLDEAENDLGEFFLLDENTNNFKTELILNDEFIYANGTTYQGSIRIKNISNVDALGLNYTLDVSDTNVASFTHDNVLGTVPAGGFKDIPFTISFNTLNINEKDIQINTTIQDINYNTWNESSTIKLYRTSQRINISSTQSNVRGYITLPNNTQKPINLSQGYIEVPVTINHDYYVVLANPDITQETAYSIGFETETNDLTNFSDTGAYEAQNYSFDGAVSIDAGTSISAYLHAGDIDFYKIKSLKNFYIFDKVTNAALQTFYISNQVVMTEELLALGNNASVINGILILNGNEITDNTEVSIGDKIQMKLISSADYNASSIATLHLGDYKSYFIVDTYKEDKTIDDFNFQNITDAIPTIHYMSNEIVISSTNSILQASITLGALIKNGIELETKETTVKENDTLRIKLQASHDFNSTITSTLRIENFSKEFNVTTRNNLVSPISYARRNTTYFSEKIIIPTDNTMVNISDGILHKNGLALSTLSTSAMKGDEIYIKLNSGANTKQTVSTTIDLGYTGDSFYITTVPNDYEFIENGLYPARGDKYYYMEMHKDSNVSITYAFNDNTTVFVSIYDKNMNLLHNTVENSIELKKDTYIVKKLYDSGQFTVSSEGLKPLQMDYDTLENKKYIKDFQILKLSLETPQKFLFHWNYGVMGILDYNFQPLSHISDISYTAKSMTIPQGNYYIWIETDPYGVFDKTKPISVYSPSLGSSSYFSSIENNKIYDFDDTYSNGGIMRFDTHEDTHLTVTFHAQTSVAIYDLNAELVISANVTNINSTDVIFYRPDTFSGVIVNKTTMTIPISKGSYLIHKRGDISFYSEALN